MNAAQVEGFPLADQLTNVNRHRSKRYLTVFVPG